MQRLVVVACVALCACGEGAVVAEGETEAAGAEIVNGAPDRGHPSVGRLRVAGRDICTATLVGKRTVLTAAHCVRGAASATAFVVDGAAHAATRWVAHPKWDPGADDGEGRNDVAVVLLASAPAAKPSPVATASPAVGQKLTLVGFGVTADNANDAGTKRIATTRISDLALTKLYWAPTAGGGSTCFGDSGGPAFAVVGGEEVQVGVTSGGVSPCAFGYAWDTRVDAFVTWIASVSGGDVVKAGAGRPAADTERPHVYVTSPRSQTSVPAGTTRVAATITDDVKVVRGELWVDGAFRQARSSAPFVFDTRLATGWHEVRVIGLDAAGNAGRYTVTVEAR